MEATDLRIDGDLGATQLSVDQLRALGVQKVAWTHRGTEHRFQAVPLESILRHLGLEPGAMGSTTAPEAKRPAWKFAVVATAGDGFQATFSAAELYAGMGPTRAFVALSEDGRPLDASVGPQRLVVPTDGEGSRSVRNLRKLTVLDLRRIVPAR